nr:chemotaxis protein CheB [Kineobactrum salinum]
MASLTTAEPPAAPARATRIVGIGASAGGLAPLEEFLAGIPPHSGIACVVVQHLDPTHKALLSELLQRVTAMPVREARQNMRIEPDCVYVIPPNTELSVVDGTLHLASPREPRGMRLPINVLFSSLAGTQGERAIAVVLSGMGSDGTLGLQAIKAVGG